MRIGCLVRSLLGDRAFQPIGKAYRSILVDLDAVVDAIGILPPNARVLDIGGGDGDVINRLLKRNADCRITMIDLADSVGGWVESCFRLDECKAQVQALASGGMPPYRYAWSAVVAPNDSALALGLCTDEYAEIIIYDTICAFDTSFLVDGYDLPEIVVTMLPDSLFNTNPEATFSFENKSADSIPLSNWTWVFPDSSSTNLLSPDYVFAHETDSVLFIYETIDGCSDTIIVPITVQDFELLLYNVFTPNGDGINDTYEIPNLDRYISNQLIVFNRWGNRVFEAKNYNNDWDGGTLPDGVYYYVLKCQGYWEEDVFHGSVSIYGSKY